MFAMVVGNYMILHKRFEKYNNQIKKSVGRFNKLDIAIEKGSELEDGLEENSQNKTWRDKNMQNIESKRYRRYG